MKSCQPPKKIPKWTCVVATKGWVTILPPRQLPLNWAGFTHFSLPLHVFPEQSSKLHLVRIISETNEWNKTSVFYCQEYWKLLRAAAVKPLPEEILTQSKSELQLLLRFWKKCFLTIVFATQLPTIICQPLTKMTGWQFKVNREHYLWWEGLAG